MSTTSSPGQPRASVLPAIRWVTVAQGARQAGQVLTVVVVAHFVPPADFGLMTMAAVVTGFVAVIRDLGVGTAVVQQLELTDEFASTQFWVALGFGLGTAGLLVASAPLVAAAYAEPRVADVLRVLAIGSVLASATIVHQALLERALRFRAVAAIEVASLAAGFVTAVVLALAGGGVWSLVAQAVVTALVSAVSYSMVSAWRPRWAFHREAAGQGWRFGSPLAGYNALNYVVRNADYALIGRVLGSEPLGYYTLAYRLMLFPQQAIVAVVNRVMIPSLSNRQAQPEEMRRLYLRSLAGSAFLGVPIAVAIGTTADRLIPAVLGPGWEPAIGLARVLSAVACLQTVGATVGPIYLATARTDLMFRWSIGAAIVIVGAFLVGVRHGVLGVAVAYAVASAILFYPSLAIALPLIGLRARDAVTTVGRSSILALVAGAAMVVVGSVLGRAWRDPAVLATQMVMGAVVYGSTSWLFNREQARRVLAVLGV